MPRDEEDIRNYRSARVERKPPVIEQTHAKVEARNAFVAAAGALVSYVETTSGKDRTQLPPVFNENPESWLELNRSGFSGKQDSLREGAIKAGAITHITSGYLSDEKFVEGKAFDEYRACVDALWTAHRAYRNLARGECVSIS